MFVGVKTKPSYPHTNEGFFPKAITTKGDNINSYPTSLVFFWIVALLEVMW
jgi:hypothetical protein